LLHLKLRQTRNQSIHRIRCNDLASQSGGGRSIRRHIQHLQLLIAGLACGCNPVAINISIKHFAEDDFVAAVENLLAASEFPAKLLTLELTESVSADNLETVIEKMQALRSLGCTFSLDDFGTGYSSLSRLQRLPISEVKIDRSFVLLAPNEPMNANIVEMVVRIGDTMGARVVAEGVETQVHADFLAAWHPHVCLQGYFFGIPQPIETFIDPEESVLY